MYVTYQITLKGHLAPIYEEWFVAWHAVDIGERDRTLLPGRIAGRGSRRITKS
jgi:hypothetical protein